MITPYGNYQMDIGYYEDLQLSCESDVIDLAYHIIDAKDLDTSTFLTLRRRVNSSCTRQIRMLFKAIIADTFSPRSHTLKVDMLKNNPLFPDRQEWEDRRYPIIEEVRLSEIDFKNGFMSYKGRTLRDHRIVSVDRRLLTTVDRTFNIETTSRTSFHFEPRTDLVAALRTARGAEHEALRKTEEEALKNIRESIRPVLEDHLRIFAEIPLSDLTVKDRYAEFVVDSSNIVSSCFQRSISYSQFKGEVRKIRNRDYPGVGIKRMLTTVYDYDSFLKQLREEYINGFSKVFRSDFYYKLDVLDWFVRQHLPVCVTPDGFLGYASYPGEVKTKALRMYDYPCLTFSRAEIDELYKICEETPEPQEVDTSFSNSPYVGIKKLLLRRLDGMMEDESCKISCHDVSGAAYRPPFLQDGSLFMFDESAFYYSAQSIYDRKNAVVLKIERDMMWMYPAAKNKAVYLFYLDSGCYKKAVFFIWAYFTSFKNNRRESFPEVFEYARHFGINDHAKKVNNRYLGYDFQLILPFRDSY